MTKPTTFAPAFKREWQSNMMRQRGAPALGDEVKRT